MYDLCDAEKSESGQFDSLLSAVCPLIDDKLCHNMVEVPVYHKCYDEIYQLQIIIL